MSVSFVLNCEESFQFNISTTDVFILMYSDIDVNQLTELRKSQLVYKLSDEVILMSNITCILKKTSRVLTLHPIVMQIAAEMFREHTRSLIEKNIVEALSILKSRSKVVYEFL
jgi:hypothetical protein